MIVEHAKYLTELLQDAYPALAVERTPSRPEQYTLRSQQGAMLLFFREARYSDPARPSPHGIEELQFELTILKKNLQRTGAADGIEEMIDDLGKALSGIRFSGFVYYPAGAGFSDYDASAGVWSYDMSLVGYRVTELEVAA